MVSTGRTYHAADGVPIDVPDCDADRLAQHFTGEAGYVTTQGVPPEKNFWSFTCPGVPCGPTADRPNPAAMGFNPMFLDTTVGAIICFNAVRGYWINPATGAEV
jgi:hypothetical protein